MARNFLAILQARFAWQIDSLLANVAVKSGRGSFALGGAGLARPPARTVRAPWQLTRPSLPRAKPLANSLDSPWPVNRRESLTASRRSCPLPEGFRRAGGANIAITPHRMAV